MQETELLNFHFNFYDKKDILELIIKHSQKSDQFIHFISINPENLVIAHESTIFAKAVRSSKYHIADGIGIVIAARLWGQAKPGRATGVDTMDMLIRYAAKHSLGCLLIGGEANLAEKVSDCYKKLFPRVNIKGLRSIKNIQRPSIKEEQQIEDIVKLVKPYFVFVAFGSPYQEIWIERHKKLFKGCFVMGVGGAFAFLSKQTSRAPKLVRQIGLEWLFRLIQQPWRIKRQLNRLPCFIYLILKERFR